MLNSHELRVCQDCDRHVVRAYKPDRPLELQCACGSGRFLIYDLVPVRRTPTETPRQEETTA